MRASKVIKNGVWGGIYQIILIILGFVGRTVFIHCLGVEYLGISALFTNILTLLSLSELGFSSAISYHLYKSLANNDNLTTSAIMCFYKKIYRIVAFTIFTIGLSLIPFLQFIITDSNFSLEYITITYIIFLIKTTCSYFFTYNFTIAIADQRKFLMTQVDIISSITISAVNICTLFIFKNFILFLSVEILLGILFNFIKTLKIRKEYSYIKNETKLSANIRKKIFGDVKNIFISKIATVVVTSTDNILISSFISITTVGIYSNYYMIIFYIKSFLTHFTSATQASLGNLFVSSTKEYSYQIVKKLTVILYFVTSSCSVCLFVLLNPFIEIWLGKEYLLEWPIILICCINFYIEILKTPLWFSIYGLGYFQKDRNIALYGAISNIIVSILAAYYWGLFGIFFGTFFSQITQFIMKLILFANIHLKISIKEYFLLFFKLLFSTILMMLGVSLACSHISFSNIYFLFVCKIIVCILVPITINYLIYRKSTYFIYFVSLFKAHILSPYLNKFTCK